MKALLVVACLVITQQPILAVAFPPHTAVDIYGVHAYSDAGPGSVPTGGEITFFVSNTHPYQAAIYRLGSDNKTMQGDELIASLGSFEPDPQPIYPGSYIHVEPGIRGPSSGLTLETWVQTAPVLNGWRGVITQYASPYQDGFGLFLSEDKVAFYLGKGMNNLSTTKPILAPNAWHHLVATWDGVEKIIWVNGEKIGSWAFSGPVDLGTEPLRLGAYGHNGKAGMFLNGTLAAPAIYSRALSSAEIQTRYLASNIEPPSGSAVLAAWPLDEEQGATVRDVSGNNQHGQIINHGIWNVGGPRFNANVPRFGYDPTTDSSRGHGLRLADDQLVDCHWPPTITWRVPAIAKSGVYVLRLAYQWNGEAYCHVPFIVRRGAGQKTAPIAVVASTHTWWAYNTTTFPQPLSGFAHNVSDLKAIRDTPRTSLYNDHNTGLPSYYVGLRTPNPMADPYISSGEEDGVGHLLTAERPLHIWLEKQNLDFEVITDLDLHRDPHILDGRQTVYLAGHNEYPSVAWRENLEKYLNNGGNLVVMSGNTGFWGVSFNKELTVMEGRKTDGPGYRVPHNRRGERYHQYGGMPGGLTRETLWPILKLIGTETIGWVEKKTEQFGPLVITSVDHPIFEGTGISAGDTLAYGAGGHEVDALPSTIAAVGNLPPGSVPPDGEGITVLGHFTTLRPDLGITVLDWLCNKIFTTPRVASDVIFWKRPEGGQVINFGSIRTAVGLRDERFSKLMLNILKHFGVQRETQYTLAALPADFNTDGKIDFTDFLHFAANFGAHSGQAGWNGACDLNRNGAVEFADFLLFVNSMNAPAPEAARRATDD